MQRIVFSEDKRFFGETMFGILPEDAGVAAMPEQPAARAVVPPAEAAAMLEQDSLREQAEEFLRHQYEQATKRFEKSLEPKKESAPT